MAQISRVLEMQEHFPNQQLHQHRDASSPSALLDAVSLLPCTNQGEFHQERNFPKGIRVEISVQRSTDPVRSSTSGSAVLELFLLQRGSVNQCSEGRNTLNPPGGDPQPNPACPCWDYRFAEAHSGDWDASSGAVSAGCHGDVKRCHLPPLSLCWDKTVLRQHSSLGAGLGLVVPPGTPLGCVPRPLSHHAGLGAGWPCWSRAGEGRRCWGEPCAFPPFPFVSFLCFSLVLSCPSQACGWTSSSPVSAGRSRVGFALSEGSREDKML